MNKSDIELLYRYNRWANQRIVDATGDLTGAQLEQKIESSFASIRATLEHIVGAEWVWLERWKGTSPTSLPTGADYSTTEAIRERFEEVERDRQKYLAGLTEEGLQQEISYSRFNGERQTHRLGRLMQHLINHSTYHRGQVATMLRQAGLTPPTTDLLYYYDEEKS
jgi:uncharacterized damage-inducible protein DinB